MNIEIRPVGEKIRSLRKQLNLKQDDLVKHVNMSATKDKPFTRNLISMIETNKAPLTKKLSESIISNISIYCEKNNIPFNFDFDEIFKTPEDQVVEYIDNFKSNLCNISALDESLEYAAKLINLAEEYDLQNDLCSLYYKLGDLCFDRDNTLALKYYTSSIAIKKSLSEVEQLKIAKNMKNIYYRQAKYSDALKVSYSKLSSDKADVKSCMFNDVLCYCRLEKYDSAFELIKELKTILAPSDSEIKTELIMTEINILNLKGDYKNCIKNYEKLLNQNITDKNRLYVLHNLIELKIKLGIHTQKDLLELESVLPTESIDSTVKSYIYTTLYDGYRSFDMKKGYNFLLDSLDLLTSYKSNYSIDKKAYCDIINKIFDSEGNVDFLTESNYDDFKLIMHSAVEMELLDQKTLLKMIHHFLNKEDYGFVTKLTERKIS